MKTARLTLLSCLIALSCGLRAQVSWDKEKYPDYDPTPHVNQKDMTRMKQRMSIRRAEGKPTRPDHWNNALTSAFPPVMNQSAGSCGSASRIYYMFAHETNAARWADGSKPENIYPTHFTWLLTWVDNQGKEVIAQHNGIPNSTVYGGSTYSELFGYQDCDDGQSNYGWMQGYDKWLHAMGNRISASANFSMPLNTEEGRELVKNYLWNHCGDDSYSTGGIVGVGVASGGNWQKIPQSTTNDALGVTDMYYVKSWGESVDHALTIVGYDDRIEFDLDGNGVTGEADKDEVGAWIIVNSWGSGWCNGGFIYCPYAEARPTATTTGYWTPEYYTPRRDYRPLRTLKVKMDYDHRSEIALWVGVSSNINASKPEKETWLRHFYYSGLGKGATRNPAPAIPMLGRWADGELHSEPMEFGYDLTDLTDGFDTSQPLKYFFRVETESFAAGSGTIYNASIIDYTIDREGVETPFEIADGGQAIANAGQKTTVTAVVQGENMPAPRNLTLDAEGVLTWQAPAGTTYDVHAYRIYKDNELLTSVNGQTLTATVTGSGAYSVSALYRINGYDVESEHSAFILAGGDSYSTLALTDAQFTVPAFTESDQTAYTIEFWVKPVSFSDYGMGIKASSGKLLFYVNASGKVVIGYDGGDFTTSTTALTKGTWQHIAIVVSATSMKVYKNGTSIISWSSGWSNSGIKGYNDLWFGKSEGTGSSNANYKTIISAPWNAAIAELRIWNTARTQTNIKKFMSETFMQPEYQSGLTHHYLGFRNGLNGNVLTDGKKKHDATLSAGSYAIESIPFSETATHPLLGMPAPTASFSLSSTTPVVGQPVTLLDASSPSTAQWSWEFTGAEPTTSAVNRPVVVFTEPGEQTVTLNITNLKGATATTTKTITVAAATLPEPDFTIPAGTLKAGDHITFLNTTPDLGASTYQWTLQGAENEDVRTTHAAATYTAYGTYTVRLTATNPAGSKSIEKEITISKVAPQPAFDIQNNVAILGEDLYLIDQTRYDPSQWTWTISSDNYNYVVNGQNSSLSIQHPGIYAVTLRAANEEGAHSLTRARAITVCTEDGQTGLKFDAADDELTTASPFGSSATSRFSIEWWMYPGALAENGMRIGDTADDLLLTTDATGAMTIAVNKKSTKTNAGYVIDNEWHHYAVTFSSGVVKCYRDGVLFQQPDNPGATSVPAMSQFAIGGSTAPMNAIIDELRVWKKALSQTQVRTYANASVADPAALTDLALYYDFNQSSGDAIDRSASQLTGQRHNFGPDGDAWTSSRGIFCLNFESTAKDVTSTYLKNYKAPFTATSAFVNGTSRFKQLATGTATSPWVQENSVVADGITTEFHVDANKSNYLTLATSWDSFASEVKNLKLYQTVTLPAGAYELTATSDKEWTPASNFLVAAAGAGLPDYADCTSQALAFGNSGQALRFILTEASSVSLGIISNMSGWACHTVKTFQLRSIGYEAKEADMRTPEPEYVLGDANGDGKISITDAVYVVNYILQQAAADFNEKAADVNGDGSITITDAVQIVNIILGQD